uniref:Mediator of RNA polymerase II transcription subunit 13 n=1 Tax=Mesocestoides corti TaxID=53468 RepID=A0A5K3FU74_MESCO
MTCGFRVQYSMNFSFFLHGESTVCASLDIRHFQKFKSLTPRILSLCRKSKGRVNVVLAPYGIIAHLITSFQPSLPNDASVEKELELWKRFYPVQLSGENYNFLNSNTHYGSFNMDFLTPNKSPQQQVSRIDSSTKRIPPNCIEQLPHFVDVLIGGFRTRYPTCFVLIAEDVLSSLTRELQDASDRRVMPAPNTRNTGAEIHSLLHPRLPLTRLPSVKRRAYLAARALQRALRCELSLLPNLDYYHINKIKSRLPIQAPADDAPFSGNSDTRKNIRSAILPMHRRFGPMSRTLRAFLSEVDTCGGGGGDAPTTAPRRQLAVADPAMPTLSPQPLNSGAFGMNTLPVVGGDSLSSSSTSAAPPAVSNQQAAHLSSGAKPPCLLNSQLQNIKDGISHNINSKPMDWEETHVAPTTYKLPRGVVRTHQVHKQGGMLTNPPPPQPPPLVRSEASGGEQSWLAEQVLYHVSEQGKCGRSHLRRPPLIRMSLMDQVSPLEHPSTSFPSEVMLKQSCVSDEIARSQRQQYHSQSSGGHPSGSTFGTLVDSHGFGADEANFHPQVQHQQQHHHASQPYFHKQDLPYLTKDSEPHTHEPHTALDGFHRTLEDELHGPGSKLDGHPKGPALMRNLSRHMPISGRSLFSSGGSGHLGAAELATMYPTPPSHESVFSVGAVGGSCTAQPSPTETKPLFVPESHHYSQSPMDESGGVPATRPRQKQGVAHSILQSFLHNSRPLFDQNVVCSHLEWQFMCPRSVQIPFSAKFRISPEELQLYKEVDIATRPPLAFHHLSFSTNGKQESLLVLPRRPPLPPVPSRAPHQHHPSRGLNQTELVFDEPASNTFDLDELRRSDSLKVNLILSDSFLNLFKDHNFDSCNICECTTSVLGVEVDVYVSSPNSAPTRSCNCGFSTLVNRKYALAGNLFWEDESEVASLSIAGVEGRKTHSRPLSTYSTAANYLPTLTQWMHGPLEEFGVRFLIEWLQHTDAALRLDDQPEGTLEKDALYDYSDICALTASALEQSACDPPSLTEGMTGDFAVRVGGRQLRLDETTHKEGVVLHPAFFRQLPGDIPSNKNDQIRLLGSVRLWLQEAIDLLESTYKVEGPLTWKAFHQLAGRGRSESSKAQPIPQFRVGGGANNGKTNVLISPFSVHDW